MESIAGVSDSPSEEELDALLRSQGGLENVVANLKAHRARRGWSQSELARRLKALGRTNLDQAALSKIESGERNVRVDEAIALAEALETSFIWLLLPGELADNRSAATYEWMIEMRRRQIASEQRELDEMIAERDLLRRRSD